MTGLVLIYYFYTVCFVLFVIRLAPGPEVIYLRHVERAKPHQAAPEEDRAYPPPQFIVPLRDAVHPEGGRVHFEARIEPVGDPTMRVEWLHNNTPILASMCPTNVFHFQNIEIENLQIFKFSTIAIT